MDEWKPVELVGKPEFYAIDPRASGLNVYKWQLSRQPERNWLQLYKDEARLATMHPVTVSGDWLTITAPEGQLQTYANQAKVWIRNVNTKYVQLVIPKQAADAKAAERKEASRLEREQRGRDEADQLELGDD